MSKPAKKVPASDGLIAREAGAWTEEKLYYVERYARAFATAMRSKWPRLVYVDLLCGPGYCIVRDSRREIAGSPLRALAVRPAFDAFHFADLDEQNVAALRQRVVEHADVVIHKGDCNSIVRQVVKDLTPRTLTLAFLDPVGLEVEFETLRVLSRHRVDIVYLFPSGIGLKRNIKQFVRSEAAKMERFWGGVEWRDLPLARRSAGQRVSTEEASIAGQWVGAFAQKVRAELGMRCAHAPPMIANDGNAVMYHLLFLSKNPKALEIWDRCRQTEASGQRLLPYRKP